MSPQDPDPRAPGIGGLDWALVIATKDRIEALQVCVTLALDQTRPPAEVIVVDASRDWHDHAARIGAIMERRPGIGFRHLPAALPSLTVQRNQGIALARAAVLFLLDDDSFMYPDCAERIMAIYDADAEARIGGIQTGIAPHPPRDGLNAGARKRQGARSASAGTSEGGIRSWLMQHLFLMNKALLFIPYDAPPSARSLPAGSPPASIAGQQVVPTTLFQGYRMTFRRQAVLEEPFDELLRYYCPGEDVDASYRVSRRHRLLTAPEARLHHFTAASGRIDRFSTTVLSVLNQAVLLRRHAADQAAARRRFFALLWRRLLAETLKDALSRRFGFPQARGILRARAGARRIFAMPPEALAEWYPAEQARIVKMPAQSRQ